MFDRRRRLKFLFIVFIGLMGYLLIYLQVIYSGITHRRLQEQRTMAINKYKDAKMDYINMTSPGSIEKYATEKLGLVNPSERQFRYIK